MILSKDSNNNWTPTAGGTGTFIGTLAAFNAIKDTLPVNTVAYITDDGNGDLQPVDAVTNGDMHPVTSNAVYDELKNLVKTVTLSNKSFTIPAGGFVGWYNLTGLTTQPQLAFVRLSSVIINGAESDCFVEIKSSKYGAHAVFTSVNSGLPLSDGTQLTVSGVASYIGE